METVLALLHRPFHILKASTAFIFFHLATDWNRQWKWRTWSVTELNSPNKVNNSVKKSVWGAKKVPLSRTQELTIESNQHLKVWAFRHSRTAVSPNQWSLESAQAVSCSYVQTMRGSFQRPGGSEGRSLGQHSLLKVALCHFRLLPLVPEPPR